MAHFAQRAGGSSQVCCDLVVWSGPATDTGPESRDDLSAVDRPEHEPSLDALSRLRLRRSTVQAEQRSSTGGAPVGTIINRVNGVLARGKL